MSPCTASRRPRPRKDPVPRLLVLLSAAAFVCLPCASSFGLPFTGYGSGGGIRIASDGALTAGPISSSRDINSRVRSGGLADADDRKWRHSRRRVVQREMTCRVQGPRKYGSGDWFSNIQNLPRSRLLYNIKGHLLFNTGFAFVVSMIHYLTPQHVIDDLHVSPIPHSIMSGALGLLLVFRTNAAYNRFWEARKVWGTIVNTCRNIARLGAVAMGPDSREWQEMKEYLRIFPFLLKQHLQDVRVDLELDFSTLALEKVNRLQEDPNPPLMACQLMSEIVAQAYSEGGAGQSGGGRVPDYTSVSYRMEIEKCLSLLIDCLGKCERILTTPVPRGYSRHTSRFLTIYGVTLPVVLVPHTELFTAPVVCAVCWGLFSIEEIAYFIEQPFDPEYRQLDLEAYSKKIARDVERMTLTSGLGRLGPASTPWLPSAVRKQGHMPSSQPLQERTSHELWTNGRVRGGRGGGCTDGPSVKDLNGDKDSKGVKHGATTKVEELSTSWKGTRDDDIIA